MNIGTTREIVDELEQEFNKKINERILRPAVIELFEAEPELLQVTDGGGWGYLFYYTSGVIGYPSGDDYSEPLQRFIGILDELEVLEFVYLDFVEFDKNTRENVLEWRDKNNEL